MPAPATCLYAAFAVATHPCARITARHYSAALASPGVVAVLDASHLPSGGANIASLLVGAVDPLFADNTSHFHGQPVALVVRAGCCWVAWKGVEGGAGTKGGKWGLCCGHWLAAVRWSMWRSALGTPLRALSSFPLLCHLNTTPPQQHTTSTAHHLNSTAPQQHTTSTAHHLNSTAPQQHSTSTAHHLNTKPPQQHTTSTPHHLNSTPPQQHTTSTPHHLNSTPPQHHTTSTAHHLNSTAPQQHSTSTAQHLNSTAPQQHSTSTAHHINSTPPQQHSTSTAQHLNSTAPEQHSTSIIPLTTSFPRLSISIPGFPPIPPHHP
ncbi:unnamed protein product [Closterium sp. Yama58-4]|nr:unnamed protein product [Closterium sp. Yama58-4]